MRFHSAIKKGEKPNKKDRDIEILLMQSNQNKEQDIHICIKVIYIHYKNIS